MADNTTAVSYINEQGGIVSNQCNDIARDIWEWTRDNDNWISAAHIAGTLNTEADQASRVFNDRTEWKLDVAVFADIVKTFGTPDIDLLATRLNAQLPRYVAWQPDPFATYINAFSITWTETFNYIFPPFSLLSRCLQKIATENARALVIAPAWPTQSWFTPLMNMLVAQPLILPEGCLTLPQGAITKHPPKAKLLACLVSGVNSEIEEFQRTLPKSYWQAGKTQLENNTRRFTVSGKIFAATGTEITARPIYPRC